MSFVYAEKNYIQFQNEKHPITHIYSDTKITLDEASSLNWKPYIYNAVKKYGIIKSIILNPRCCISFAGNNIAYAHKLLEQLYAWQSFTDDQLINLAYQIHKAAPVDDIEFIICLADEKDETRITCIKNNSIATDNLTAWIGSRKAFETMQKIRIEKNKESGEPGTRFSYQAFKRTLVECGDDSVGGFEIMIIYDRNEHSFFYAERAELSTERLQIVKPGEAIRINGIAEEGACTVHYHESSEDVLIDIEQADLSILYTRKMRVDADERSKYFLLPISIRTSTQRVI